MVLRILAFNLTGIGVFAALLFGAAGRVDLPWLWAYLAVWSLYIGGSSMLAWRINPDLVAERMRPPSDRDRLTRLLAIGPGLGHLVVAGLDVGRFGWSHVGPGAHVAGLLAVAAGMTFVGWTFVTNRFASSAVRIQSERGHTVVDTGPYALVRHPMYLGVFLVALGSGPALGSWWAALVIAPIIPIFVRRTRLEDRMLHQELAGYPEYAARTRWRVVPWIF